MHTGIDRRVDERFNYKSAILHSTNPPDFFYRGTMHNFSTRGLYFESDEDLLQGDEISVAIQDPPQPLNKKSREYFDIKIMWCKVLQSTKYQVGYGAQIIFSFS
jgi:hypothetical protein